MKDLTPINPAEAVIEAFYDPAISGLADWKKSPSGSHGFQATQGWAFVNAGWARKPSDGLAFWIERGAEIPLGGYDRLIVGAFLPDGATMKVIAQTDKGPREKEFAKLPGDAKEYVLDLAGAGELKGLRIEARTNVDDIGAVRFIWVMLQNSKLLAAMQAQPKPSADWPKHLVPADTELKFEPAYGIVLTAEDLDRLAEVDKKLKEAGQANPFDIAVEAAKKKAPEAMTGDFANIPRSRDARDRDAEHWLQQTGSSVLLAGLVRKDPELVRLGTRYALSIAFCDSWYDGFMDRLPGGQWTAWGFIPSLNAHDVATTLDLGGGALTDAGRRFLLRRLAEQGLGAINYSYYVGDYVHKSNQAAWFSPARLLSLTVLDKNSQWMEPHVPPAMEELTKNLDRTVLEDGTYPEGPLYFRCVGRDAGLAFYYYANAWGHKLSDVLPERIKKTADYAEVVSSTVPGQDFIPYGDSGQSQWEPLAHAIMAKAMPGSAFERMLEKARNRNPLPETWPFNTPYSPNYLTGLTDRAITWKLAGPPRESVPEHKAFLQLPVSGYTSSTRKLDGGLVKLLVYGNPPGAGHMHEDKGSFTLEAFGQTVLGDGRIYSYSDPDSERLKFAQFHNMLVPTGTPERPAPPNPLPQAIKPVAGGDETKFHAVADLSPGWEKYYKFWKRTWDSPTPDQIIIRDDFELIRGEGVEQVFISMLPAKITDGKVILGDGLATLTPPEGADVSMRRIRHGGPNESAVRLSFKLPVKSGPIETKVTLAKKP